MKDKLYNKLIDQINIEFLAFYKYFGMAQYAHHNNFEGLKDWLFEQAQEEKGHAEKIINHLQNLNKPIILKPIEAVSTDYTNVDTMIATAIENEKFVSKCFREIYEIAMAEKEYESRTLIEWFIDEQVEEEKKFEDLLLKMRQYEKDLPSLRLDKFLKNMSKS